MVVLTIKLGSCYAKGKTLLAAKVKKFKDCPCIINALMKKYGPKNVWWKVKL